LSGEGCSFKHCDTLIPSMKDAKAILAGGTHAFTTAWHTLESL
jgi:hypothetical protein